jgi:hypothetical protein
METLGSILEIKTSNILSNEYYCDICDYKCGKRFNFDRHILTPKHIKEIERKCKRAKHEQNEQNNKQIIKEFECEKCNKIYQTHAGLWKHKQKCNTTIVTGSNDENFDKDQLIIMLIKQNAELIKETTDFKHIMLEHKTMMMKVVENGTHNTTNNTTNNTNSHNKAFNLNFFLNETCKDAMNIEEFVSSIKVSLDDLENTGRQGYIEGISSIILNKLNNLSQYDRPIHCADQKREILYIKNDNQWFKEGEEKPLLTKAIKTIANENIKQIKTWRDKNPECTDSDSKKNNLYLKIVSNSMNGSTEAESDKNINRIIKNIVKETIIDK